MGHRGVAHPADLAIAVDNAMFEGIRGLPGQNGICLGTNRFPIFFGNHRDPEQGIGSVFGGRIPGNCVAGIPMYGFSRFPVFYTDGIKIRGYRRDNSSISLFAGT